MLTGLFAKPLALEIGEHTLRFETLADFEFALAGRTNVPANKLAALGKLSPDDLTKEAKNIKNVERRFVALLTQSTDTPQATSDAFDAIDTDLFSQDHDWRQIVLALQRKHGLEYAELKRMALVKYLQYLTSRQELIKHTYSVKQLEKEKVRPNEQPEMSANMLKETVVLDSTVITTNDEESDQFTRLPKGEAKLVRLREGERMEMRLSTHPFQVLRKGKFELIDLEGHPHALQDGKNIIGRDVACNVVVDASCRDISRLHVILEPLDNQQVRLTDLSSHGTFVQSQFFVETDATGPRSAA